MAEPLFRFLALRATAARSALALAMLASACSSGSDTAAAQLSATTEAEVARSVSATVEAIEAAQPEPTPTPLPEPSPTPLPEPSPTPQSVALSGSWVPNDADRWSAVLSGMLSTANADAALVWLSRNPPNAASMALVRRAGQAQCDGAEPPDLVELIAPGGGIGAGLDPQVIEIIGGLLGLSHIIECPMSYLDSIGSADDLVIVNRLRASMGVSEVTADDLAAYLAEVQS